MRPTCASLLRVRNPDHVRIVGAALVGGEIPVFSVAEAGGVAVEKSELGASAVQIGVNVVLLGHCRAPVGSRSVRDGGCAGRGDARARSAAAR